ncbi:MAG TPA: recombinase family protein [Trueperaceae bacterium]
MSPATPENALRAGIYSRQSRDKTKSIEDQSHENRAAVEAQGWQLVAEYADGTSASRFARKARDDWQRVLADIDAGKLDVLVLWEPSRGDRTPETWLALLSLCRDRGVGIHVTTHHRTYDMTNPRDWRTLAEDGIDSAYESEKIRQRVTRGQASAARAGRPSQGRCPYGYRRVYDPATGALVGQEPDPNTAGVVREIIERVARGVPISTIVADLNARDVPRPGGARRWYRVRVRDLAMNPAYIGQRVYRGQTFPGTWEPLVDEATFWAAQRVLADPGRTKTRPGRVRHLLSYLGICAVCEPDRRAAGDDPSPLTAVQGRYRCLHNSCVTIAQEASDEFVTMLVLARLREPDIYAQLHQVGEDSDRIVMAARAEAARLRDQLDRWRLSAARGETTPESLAVIEAELTANIEAAEQRAQRAIIPPALRQVLEPGADIETRWAAMPLPARRAVVRTLAVIKVSQSSRPGSRRFEPGRFGQSYWIGDTRTWDEIWTTRPRPDVALLTVSRRT